MVTNEGTSLDLAIGVKVYANEKQCGRSVAFIINPVSDRVTDVAVQLNGLGGKEVLIPVRHILRSSRDGIWFDLSRDEVKAMPEFLRTVFIEVDIPQEFSPGALMMWPYVTYEAKEIPIEVESVPFDELAIHTGADVISLDGKVGKVDEFLITPEDERISHLVMREGHLWGKDDVLIPVSAISKIGEHKVRVDLDKQQIEALPKIKVHRNGKWFSTG